MISYAKKIFPKCFFFDIEDNYFGWILEITAGHYFGLKDKFRTNNFHPNAGVYLVNIRQFRKDQLYKKAVFVSKSYHSFDCPVQDILITIANYKFKFIPLNFNLCLFYDNEEDKLKKKRIKSIQFWMDFQKFSPHKYTFDEILKAISDPVIYHFYIGKIQNQRKCHKFLIQWIKYAKLTGRYKFLKMKYSKPFECEIFIN